MSYQPATYLVSQWASLYKQWCKPGSRLAGGTRWNLGSDLAWTVSCHADHQSRFFQEMNPIVIEEPSIKNARVPLLVWVICRSDKSILSKAPKYQRDTNIKGGMTHTVISAHHEIFITKAILFIIKGSDFLLSCIYICLACLLLLFSPCLFVLEQKMKDSPSCRDWLKGNITGSGGRAARYWNCED